MTRVLLLTNDWPVPGVARPPSPARQQAVALREAGLAVDLFLFRGRPLYNYAAAWTRLRASFRDGRWDLVHAHFASTGLLALPKRAPLVVTLRRADLLPGDTDPPSGRLGGLVRAIARLLAGRADAVIVPCDAARRCLHTRTPVHLIPPDLDLPALATRLVDVYRAVLAPSRLRGTPPAR